MIHACSCSSPAIHTTHLMLLVLIFSRLVLGHAGRPEPFPSSKQKRWTAGMGRPFHACHIYLSSLLQGLFGSTN
uniref:Secreted protein n=1 Tax=Setaria viridis TaxID=4556 RepID=A0A4U6VQ51_SETVI|nr:hypothetical protein SEVIR_3G425350v2 [Setaria viridis]